MYMCYVLCASSLLFIDCDMSVIHYYSYGESFRLIHDAHVHVLCYCSVWDVSLAGYLSLPLKGNDY